MCKRHMASISPLPLAGQTCSHGHPVCNDLSVHPSACCPSPHACGLAGLGWSTCEHIIAVTPMADKGI